MWQSLFMFCAGFFVSATLNFWSLYRQSRASLAICIALAYAKRLFATLDAGKQHELEFPACPDSLDFQDSKESRNSNELRDSKESRDSKDSEDSRDFRESHDYYEASDADTVDYYDEPITSKRHSMDRFILLPIQYPEIWKLYKECLASFWTVDEVNLEKDVQQYRLLLTAEEKTLLDATLGFFACADGIVGENLVSRFSVEVTVPEARAFYANQIMMETIHAEMYSVIIDQLCPSVDEKNILLNGFRTNSCIQEKADYALRYIEDNKSPFGARLLGFLVVEGIFFSASFASIFWFKQRGILPGIIFSNELIARDEAAHCRCCVALYSLLRHKLTEPEVHAIFARGIEIEKRFARSAILVSLEGLELSSMERYIEYVANYWLAALGYGPVVVPAPKNPFPFMEMISLPGKGNFFECGVSEYGKPDSSGKFADISRTDF